jgi:hypothetical protein
MLCLALGALLAGGLGRSLPAAKAATVTTCERFGTVNVAGKTSIVQNNLWNPAATGAQCLSVNDVTGAFTITTANNTGSSDGAPASYPAILKGCHWGNCTTNSGMPIRASSVGSATTSWNVSTGSGSWDAAYDIWFNSTASTSGQPDGLELMIWINHMGPPQPIGSRVATVWIAGANWDVWVGNIGWNVVSYVRTSGTNSVSFDLKPFFNDSQSRGQLQSGWYLITVEAGFELWQGGAGMASNAFSLAINSGPTPTPNPSSWFMASNQNSNKCVDDANWGTSNGSALQQWACGGNAPTNQQWQLQPTDSGYYKVISRYAPGLSWDVSNWGTANGSKVHLWSYGGGSNQQWMPVALGNGYYKFVARNSGKCLDVPAASTADGVQLQIWDCNGTGAQAFRMAQQP